MQNTSDHLFFVFLILTWLKKNNLSFAFAFEVMRLASYVSIIIQQKYGYKSDYKKNHARLP